MITQSRPRTNQTKPAEKIHAASKIPPTLLKVSKRFLALKYTLDFVLSLIILILSTPILILAAILIKATSRGPVFYTQVRMGKDGRLFKIVKLRSMTHDCEAGTGPQWCKPNDARVTWIGSILRKTHIDELPQLWNVLRGQMSLVGPRPERPEFVPQLGKFIPRYRERLQVRPGITGLAQVQLPPDSDLESVRRKLIYDLYYIQHASIWLDMRLMITTALAFLFVPFSLLRFVLRLPSGKVVEEVNEISIVYDSEGLAELQPVLEAV